jgi:hypothetical protein
MRGTRPAETTGNVALVITHLAATILIPANPVILKPVELFLSSEVLQV